MASRTLFLALALSLISAGCTTAPSADGTNAEQVYHWTPQSDPITARAYSSFLVGRFASLTNDPREAAIRYAEVVEGLPGDGDLAEQAVFSALLSGEMATATRIASNMDEGARAKSSLPRLTLAADALKRGKPKRAEAVLAEGRFNLFNHLVAGSLNAWSVYERKGETAALKSLGAASDTAGIERGITSFTRALIHAAASEDDRALAELQKLWDEGGRFAEAAELQARLLARAGRAQEALNILATFREDIGDNPAVTALHAEINAGAMPKASKITAQSGAALGIFAPASLLAAQTRGDVSGVYFALALELDPSLHSARTLWAAALDSAGRREDAISVLQVVPDASPYYATARTQLAWSLRREDKNIEAIATAREALAHSPTRRMQIEMGNLYRSLERFGEAGEVFDGIVKADAAAGREADWRMLFARGASYERMGRWPEAEADLNAALKLAPNDAQLLNYLGYSWIDRGLNMERGFDLIRKAVSLRPNSGMIVDSLGWAHFKRGEYDAAVRYLERAVELEPGDPVLNDHLGDAYWRTGRRLEASFQWTRSLSLEPKTSDAERTQAKLDNGMPADNGARVATRTP